jgi:2-haloacid dehalogenase
MARQPQTLVFDIGNVLIEWDPRFLYRKIFADEAEMEWFLGHVCTPAWNLEQDRGRAMADAVALLVARHPAHETAIRAFDTRWLETVSGPIPGSVELLARVRAAGIPDYAITNFSHEKFPIAKAHFPFLEGFRGTIVSGEEKLLKPEPAIYRLLLDRYGLEAADCVFIDDSPANVEGARSVGMHAVHFTDPGQLAADLRAFGFSV